MTTSDVYEEIEHIKTKQGALETLDYFIEKPEEPENTNVTDEIVTGE